jgi:hypothetical protein
MRIHLVSDINQKTPRIDAQNDTLHRSDVMVFYSEISQQSNDWVHHGLVSPSRPLPQAAMSQSQFVIASDQRERSNLITLEAL